VKGNPTATVILRVDALKSRKQAQVKDLTEPLSVSGRVPSNLTRKAVEG